MPKNYIVVGKITTSHGNRGEVKVLPLTDSLEQFSPGRKFQVIQNNLPRILEIEGVRQHKGFLIIKFIDVHHIHDAKLLRETLLEIPRQELVSLPEGNYYAFEIVGLKVITTEGKHLGRVVKVINGLAHDIYEVAPERNGSGKQQKILIPAVHEIVKEIDIGSGIIVIRLIPGLE